MKFDITALLEKLIVKSLSLKLVYNEFRLLFFQSCPLLFYSSFDKFWIYIYYGHFENICSCLQSILVLSKYFLWFFQYYIC